MVARFNISFSTWIQKYDIRALTANREYTCELLCDRIKYSLVPPDMYFVIIVTGTILLRIPRKRYMICEDYLS